MPPASGISPGWQSCGREIASRSTTPRLNEPLKRLREAFQFAALGGVLTGRTPACCNNRQEPAWNSNSGPESENTFRPETEIVLVRFLPIYCIHMASG